MQRQKPKRKLIKDVVKGSNELNGLMKKETKKTKENDVFFLEFFILLQRHPFQRSCKKQS